MRAKCLPFLMIAIFTLNSLAIVQAKTDEVPKAVQELYPTLTSGALSYATLANLPDGIILKAGDVEITADSILQVINSQSEQSKEEVRKNAFYVLEQEAGNRLLLQLAKKSLVPSVSDISGQDDAAILQEYFEKTVFKTIEVTDQELKTFYENNKDMCGGASFEQIGASLKDYLISQKKQDIANGYIRDLGKQISIQVSESWVKEKAMLAFDNPVDKARQSKKPSMVDFGASGCRPCDMMAPILETLGKKYEGKLNVIFIHVREQQILASRYGIQSIPVQIFYDKDGKEVFRHAGFFPQDEIEKQLKEIGVQ